MRCRELDIFKILGIFSQGFFLEEFFWRNFFGGIFCEKFLEGFLGGFFWEEFFGRIFLEGFLGGLFLEEFFERNSLFYFNVEGIDLFVNILVFVKILLKAEGRRTNLDPDILQDCKLDCKYIALKN